MERRRYRWNHPGRHLFSGFVFLAIGLVFLLGNMGLVNVDVAVRFWPVLLIAAGVFKLVEYHDDYRGGSGVFWILVGTLFLMGNFHILRMAARDIWPVILIGIGGLMLWRSVVTRRERDTEHSTAEDPAHVDEPPTSSNSILSATAVLGGAKRRNNSQDFRGGDVTAIMGGCEIDLRSAIITPPHEAVLEVFAMWGGIVIRVPPDWTVIGRVDPILGGFDDKTTSPKDESRRFVVRGSVVMGGIEVKN
jgi:predicted membrane protein